MSIITATATQETLYLCSVPGMKKSIIEASKEPLEDSVRTLAGNVDNKIFKTGSKRHQKD